ncbi:flagellin N-terminal helical domain-containing protein [Novipirellula artificiosorum]|uniref:Flagellin n=1 Tax=Novipirellula artificiosorum TaxID=2528016 RepID=A0A5C6DVP2_9BACT|nr:flagellin [Novipirellula artificiosorum]TWU40415.1 B-type flagellin [Novipirellula artificiosorum]
MTRINTNVSSLVAQNRLNQSNNDLQTALTRLSTGLRINSGKDDPAGLIASEALRSEITGMNKAISNTNRANQIITTADSALGQVSSLLSDVRGLVVEAANTGALSADEIAANQLQVDSSLEAINRIAQTTTFQGRKLLDGGLDFITKGGTNAANIKTMQIDQANLGATGSVDVQIDIQAAATQAAVDVGGFEANVTGVASTGDIAIGADAGATAATATLTIAAAPPATAASGTVSIGADTLTFDADAAGLAGNIDVVFTDAGGGGTTAASINGSGQLEIAYDVTAGESTANIQSVVNTAALGFTVSGAGAASTTGGVAATGTTLSGGADIGTATTIDITAADGAAGNVAVTFLDAGASGATTAAINATTGAIEVSYDFAAATAASAIQTAIDGLTDFSATLTGTGSTTGGTPATDGALTGGADTTTAATISVTADDTGVAGDVAVTFVDGGASSATSAAINSTTGAIEVTYDFAAATAAADIQTAIDGLDGFSATLTGSGNTIAGTGATDGALAGGVDTSGGVKEDAVFELAGTNGSEVFNVSKGTSLDQLVAQINLVSDATGITAAADGEDLQLRSSAYGSDSLVDLRVISEGTGGNFGAGAREVGTDVKATINGREANSTGNQISLNTATLDLSLELAADQTDSSSFTITGGGALFQLGADVVSNQQARIGIGSVSAARLGGSAGKLFQLGSGGSASLSTDPNQAAEIVTEAINQVTSLRGRLGAFQATTLESNMVSLKDTVANLQEAESSIRDADFAQESAALTRAQILVQSGTNVLSMANQNPQNVLSLLR